MLARVSDSFITSVGEGLPGPPVLDGLRVVGKDVSDLLLDFRGPLVVELEGLEIFFNLRELGESKDAGAYIFIGNSPGESQLSLRES